MVDVNLSHVALRVTAGAFILNAGSAWSGTEQTAAGVHGMATGTYPFLKSAPPRRFLKLLAGTEIALGAALLTPFVPARVAGAALTGFSGGPARPLPAHPGHARAPPPDPAGHRDAKDVWLLGIGAGLLADDLPLAASA